VGVICFSTACVTSAIFVTSTDVEGGGLVGVGGDGLAGVGGTGVAAGVQAMSVTINNTTNNGKNFRG
jgi:hypothetical protein